MAKTIPWGEWAPDLSDLGSASTQDVQNVVPRSDGYGPFKSLQAFTEALPANPRGYFFARRNDGSISVFAATSTELYLLNNTSLVFEVVSQATYPAIPTDANWQFAQFNDLVIAVQVNVPPQKYTLNVGGTFVDLGGTPPQAGRIAIINRFVVLTQILSNKRRVQWSDLDGPETWTAGVGLSDFQDEPDGGSCYAVSGGDNYGLVFQDDVVRSFVYAPGSAYTFQITKIAENETLFAPYSIITSGALTFYCSAAGFKMSVAGGKPIAIGKDRVDATFFEDVDRTQLQLVMGATDPTSTRVYFSYKSIQGLANQFDKILCFDPALGERGRWSPLLVSGLFLASLAKPGITLEGLDKLAPGALTVLGAANNGSGLIRLTLNATSNAFFNIAGQNFIVVQGVEGTVEANGTWRVNIIDPTHIDLIGSAFVNAYTQGGAIGGSLDAMTLSLDSYSTAVVSQLSAFGADRKIGFFSGPNLEGTMETPEADGEGRLMTISDLRPMTDCTTAMVSVGYRLNQSATVAYTDEVLIDDQGEAGVKIGDSYGIETRYARGRLRCPAGSSWSYARGIQPTAGAAGSR